jgi:hypothetical protein
MTWMIKHTTRQCYWIDSQYWVAKSAPPLPATKPRVPTGYVEVSTEANLQLPLGTEAMLQHIRLPYIKGAWKLNVTLKRAYWNNLNLRVQPPLPKKPIYPPWGYAEVSADSPEARQGVWEELQETIPGKGKLRWAVSDSLLWVNGPPLNTYLSVGDQIRTKWGRTSRIKTVHADRLSLEKQISDKNGGSEAWKRWAGAMESTHWAYVKKRIALAHTTNTPVSPLEDITLGFTDLGVSGPGTQHTPLEFGTKQTVTFRSIRGLERFSRTVGGHYYAQWGDANPENPSNPVKGSLIDKIKHSMLQATRIHFNLDGFSSSSGTQATTIATLDKADQCNIPITYKELLVVLKSQIIFEKTSFYQRGTLLNETQLKQILGSHYPSFL